jgi:putative endonuclease
MAKTDKKITGDLGEKKVCKFLKHNKYKIICRNYRTNFGEIDIIAENDCYRIFVEVKTRGINSQYAPALAVTKDKQKKIMKSAYMYLKNFPTDKKLRFDVAEVIHNNNKVISINYIKNGFSQGGNYAVF